MILLFENMSVSFMNAKASMKVLGRKIATPIEGKSHDIERKLNEVKKQKNLEKKAKNQKNLERKIEESKVKENIKMDNKTKADDSKKTNNKPEVVEAEVVEENIIAEEPEVVEAEVVEENIIAEEETTETEFIYVPTLETLLSTKFNLDEEMIAELNKNKELEYNGEDYENIFTIDSNNNLIVKYIYKKVKRTAYKVFLFDKEGFKEEEEFDTLKAYKEYIKNNNVKEEDNE